MVIPIHDRNPTRRVPIVTYALIAANAVVFLISPIVRGTASGQAACRIQGFYLHWGALPEELTTNQALPYTLGRAAGPGLCFKVARNYDKWPALSALTSMFVHSGWVHLLGNMLFLWVFGNNVEDRFGRVRFLFFYLAVGMAAAYSFAFTRPDSQAPLVGASGAIAGVLGAYLVLYPRARVTSLLVIVPVRLPAWVVLAAWFILQAFDAYGAGADAGVAYLVHVFGFGFGVIVAAAVAIAARGRRRVPPRPAPGGW
ncbi:MAG: rhomboid family intramembrane serine protease [Mycobacteriales bacterium]